MKMFSGLFKKHKNFTDSYFGDFSEIEVSLIESKEFEIKRSKLLGF